MVKGEHLGPEAVCIVVNRAERSKVHAQFAGKGRFRGDRHPHDIGDLRECFHLGNRLDPRSLRLDIDAPEPGFGHDRREFLCKCPGEFRPDMLNRMVVDRGDVGHADVIGRDEDGAGRDLLFERTRGAERDDPVDTGDCHGRKVCPEIDPVRRPAILVAHQHHDLAGEKVCVAKRCGHALFFEIGDGRKEQACPTDDTKHQEIPPAPLPEILCIYTSRAMGLRRRIGCPGSNT